MRSREKHVVNRKRKMAQTHPSLRENAVRQVVCRRCETAPAGISSKTAGGRQAGNLRWWQVIPKRNAVSSRHPGGKWKWHSVVGRHPTSASVEQTNVPTYGRQAGRWCRTQAGRRQAGRTAGTPWQARKQNLAGTPVEQAGPRMEMAL